MCAQALEEDGETVVKLYVHADSETLIAVKLTKDDKLMLPQDVAAMMFGA